MAAWRVRAEDAAMRRLLLPIVLATLAFPAAANASVLSTVSNGTLTITGDAADDRIIVKPGSAGAVLVNDQTFSGVSKLVINSGAGADEIRIDSVAIPATIQSGPGADVIAGGPAADTIAAGDDADLVDGGAGPDSILLGLGNDTALETDGNVDGQGGTDTVRVNGSDESEEFTLQALGTHARVVHESGGLADMVRVETAEVLAAGGADLVDIGDMSATELTRIDADLGPADGAPDTVFAAGTGGIDGIGASIVGDAIRVSGLKADLRVENSDADRVIVQGLGGNDKLTAIGDVPGLTLEGNEGADDLTGAAGPETLRGGPGNDRARGNGGADRIELGDGDDVATFRLSDGADTITGDGGADRLAVQGTSADEVVEVRATRVGAANVVGVETVEPAPGSGTDTVAVGDLTGSAVKTVAVDLGGSDLRVDTVSVAGSSGPDKVKVAANGAGHVVTGLTATVAIDTTDPGQKIVVDGGEGDDEINASGMTKDETQPFLLGGPGKDVILGSPGQDVITGGLGVDVAFLAGGLDTYTWVPGDGGDIVEGGAGTDFLQMDGTTAGDGFSVTPIGGRARAALGSEVLDTSDVERLDLFPAAGPDQIHVADMSGTDVTHVELTLALARNLTTRDGSQDFVAIDGSNGNDAITVTAGGPEVRATGLAATTVTRFADKSLDRFHIDTRLGNDSVFVDPLVHQLLLFTSI
jgi:Ca2+-binding RTX toxin-like protein